MPAVPRGREPYVVYVDEAGDRGWSGKSSPVFVLSAVVIRRKDEHLLREMLNGINGDLKRPADSVLHWSENLRDHSDRKHVCEELAKLPATLISVVICKRSLVGHPTALTDPEYQYTYAVRRLLERVSWFVDKRYGIATLHFAHVRRFKYDMLHSYLAYLSLDSQCKITWRALKNGTRPLIEQPTQIRSLQVSDLVAGAVYAAVRTDRYGKYEASYLRAISGRFWRGSTNKLGTYGLHFINGPNHLCHEHYDWWVEIAAASGMN